MSETENEIRQELRAFLLREFLPGEDPSRLTDDTQLFTQGILDSISVLQFTVFIEKRFGIKLQGRDLNRRSLDTVAAAARLVLSKTG